MQKMAFIKWRGRCETLPEQEQEHCHLFVSSINQSMAVTDAGTKVPLCPYHTFYTLLIFKYNLYLYTQIGLQFRQDQLCNQK